MLYENKQKRANENGYKDTGDRDVHPIEAKTNNSRGKGRRVAVN